MEFQIDGISLLKKNKSHPPPPLKSRSGIPTTTPPSLWEKYSRPKTYTPRPILHGTTKRTKKKKPSTQIKSLFSISPNEIIRSSSNKSSIITAKNSAIPSSPRSLCASLKEDRFGIHNDSDDRRLPSSKEQHNSRWKRLYSSTGDTGTVTAGNTDSSMVPDRDMKNRPQPHLQKNHDWDDPYVELLDTLTTEYLKPTEHNARNEMVENDNEDKLERWFGNVQLMADIRIQRRKKEKEEIPKQQVYDRYQNTCQFEQDFKNRDVVSRRDRQDNSSFSLLPPSRSSSSGRSFHTRGGTRSAVNSLRSGLNPGELKEEVSDIMEGMLLRQSRQKHNHEEQNMPMTTDNNNDQERNVLHRRALDFETDKHDTAVDMDYRPSEIPSTLDAVVPKDQSGSSGDGGSIFSTSSFFLPQYSNVDIQEAGVGTDKINSSYHGGELMPVEECNIHVISKKKTIIEKSMAESQRKPPQDQSWDSPHCIQPLPTSIQKLYSYHKPKLVPNASRTQNIGLSEDEEEKDEPYDESPEKQKLASSHHRQKTLKSIFHHMQCAIGAESEQLNRMVFHFQTQRYLRRIQTGVFRTWSRYTQSQRQMLQWKCHIYEIKKRIRPAFSLWLDQTQKSNCLERRLIQKTRWNRLSSLVCHWKKWTRGIRRERRMAVETVRKFEDMEMNRKATDWYYQHFMIKALLGWECVARMECQKKMLQDGKSNRREKVKALMERVVKEQGKNQENNIMERDDSHQKMDVQSGNAFSLLINEIAQNEKKEGSSSLSALVTLLEQCSSHHSNESTTDSKIAQLSLPCAQAKKILIETNVSTSPQPKKKNNCKESPPLTHQKRKKNISMPATNTNTTTNTATTTRIPPQPPKLLRNMQKRHQERLDRRKELQLRTISALHLREHEKRNAETIKQEQENLKQSEKEDTKRQYVERRKEKHKLAGLHYQLQLLSCGFRRWNYMLEHKYLKEKKACLLWEERTLENVWRRWIEFVKEIHRSRKESSRKKMQDANEYYRDNLLFKSFRVWNVQMKQNRSKVEILKIRHRYYTGKKCLMNWKRVKDEESIMWYEMEQKGALIDKRLKMRVFFEKWQRGMELIRNERVTEENVRAKWVEVRKWLDDLPQKNDCRG